MDIQKYKATITDSELEVVGYISEIRECLGSGIYTKNTDYLISVTEKSMPESDVRGCFLVKKETIIKIE